MSDMDFYRAFEDRHRGSRDLVKDRLQVYVQFIYPLKDIYSACESIDLGCGRGEWLELAKDNGFLPHGVDLDEGMLKPCRERGLSVENQDVLNALKSLPDNSQCIVSGFHIVEHIPFDVLKGLIKESLRVLKPAGLLILETPNSENLSVGTSGFYIDPTHQRPIPMYLLAFLPEYEGFSRTKILRLQEPPDLREASDIGLFDVLHGVSPDYAVVAQKTGNKEDLALFDSVFDKEFGLSLEGLSERFDSNLSRRIQAVETMARNAEERAKHLEHVYQSRSWRITAPLRSILNFLRKAD